MKNSNPKSVTTYFVVGVAALVSGITALVSSTGVASADHERGEAVAGAVQWLTLGFGIALIVLGVGTLTWSTVLYRRAQSEESGKAQADSTSSESSWVKAGRAQAELAEPAQVRPAMPSPAAD